MNACMNNAAFSKIKHKIGTLGLLHSKMWLESHIKNYCFDDPLIIPDFISSFCQACRLKISSVGLHMLLSYVTFIGNRTGSWEESNEFLSTNL